jgi:hypothetical protein
LFFIVGRGRSGTTLLQNLLNANPNLAVAREGQFIMMLQKKYMRTKWDSDKISEFYSDLWREKRLQHWNLGKEQLMRNLLMLGEHATYASLCKIVYAEYAISNGKENVTMLGDKNPIYSLFVGNLLRLFPDAKFIHLVRDYRDNILSYQKVNFDSSNTVALAYRWRKYNEEILKFRRNSPEKFLLVRYEDILLEPEIELSKICKFLGVDYTPTMLEFYKYKQYMPQREWHQNLANPLNKDKVFEWGKKMKRKDICHADYVCRDLASWFGYDHQGNGSFRLWVETRPGVILGWLLTMLEKMVFYIPAKLNTSIINYYRQLTGSLRRSV